MYCISEIEQELRSDLARADFSDNSSIPRDRQGPLCAASCSLLTAFMPLRGCEDGLSKWIE